MTKRIKIIAELTYDEDLWYKNKEEKDWFFNEVLNEDLILHSNDVGDAIGTIKIKEILTKKGD